MRSFAARTGSFLGKALTAPILAVLLLLEPIVSFICIAVLILGIFASVVFEISAVGPKFPFLKMMALSLSFGVLLILYQGLLWLLVED